MKKRTIIRIIIGFCALILLSVGVLAGHIYSVTKKNTAENINQRQLSRIDFKEPIDSTEAAKIRSFVAGLDGVDGTHFNIPDGIFIYTYKVNTQNSLDVYQKVMSLGNYKAEQFIVRAEDIKSKGGCPMKMNDHSFMSYLSVYVSKLF